MLLILQIALGVAAAPLLWMLTLWLLGLIADYWEEIRSTLIIGGVLAGLVILSALSHQ